MEIASSNYKLKSAHKAKDERYTDTRLLDKSTKVSTASPSLSKQVTEWKLRPYSGLSGCIWETTYANV